MENWLRKSGAAGLEDVQLADFPVTGRGVGALRPFKRGERILSIPGDTLWTADHAYADSLLGPVLRSTQPPLSVEDTLAIYLLFVRSCESGHDGPQSHLAMLPRRYSSSIFFAEDELEVCAGSSLHTLTKHLCQNIEDDYRQLVERMLEPHPDLFPLDKFTIDDYKWALCTLWSRLMDFQLPDGKSLRLMAPFADMVNHAPDVEQCHSYDPSSGTLSILAGKDYEVGDQVSISYGSIPNNRLLRLYGFVIPDNPHDSYDLFLTTSPVAPFYDQKQALWESAGLDSTSVIPLTIADSLPRNVLRYLRIQRLNEQDIAAAVLENIDTNENFNDSKEVDILNFLISSVDDILGSFGIQMDELEERLAKNVYPVGGNSWAAAHVSLGEQRVLRLTRQRAADLLAALRCANCEKTSVKLMLCAACRTVRYCGRDCQVAHHREHKPVCRAASSRIGSG